MRKRFKTNRLASSDNYEVARKLHLENLKEWHYANIEEVTTIVKRQKYIKVFGKLIPISDAELQVHNTLIITTL